MRRTIKETPVGLDHRIPYYGEDYDIFKGVYQVGTIRLRSALPSMIELLRNARHSGIPKSIVYDNAAYVTEFEIFEPWRREGLGTSALKMAELLSSENGFRRFRVFIHASNKPMCAFLEKNDYIAARPFRDPEPAFMYEKHIDERNKAGWSWDGLAFYARVARHKDGLPIEFY